MHGDQPFFGKAARGARDERRVAVLALRDVALADLQRAVAFALAMHQVDEHGILRRPNPVLLEVPREIRLILVHREHKALRQIHGYGVLSVHTPMLARSLIYQSSTHRNNKGAAPPKRCRAETLRAPILPVLR